MPAAPTISFGELRQRLRDARQPIQDDDEDPNSTYVWPTPETIVTFGENIDETLATKYRQRYFVDYLKSREHPVSVLRSEPAFALPEPIRRELETNGNPDLHLFLDGAGRWFCRRLARFDSVLLWPGYRDPRSGRSLFDPDEKPLSALRAALPSDPAEQAEFGAVVLDLNHDPNWLAVWQAVVLVSGSFSDLFVSDAHCREVYLLHHHDKVVVSIPDDATREEMVADLKRWSDLIEDCSNYVSDWDDEANEDTDDETA